MHIEDSHPLWETHSGGEGHRGPEWTAGDEDRALAYYQALSPMARRILDYLLETPGRRISCYEIAERFDLDPDRTRSVPHVVAGYFNSAGEANRASGRRSPFTWWSTQYGADYAVKRTVAELFRSALR